MMGNVSSASLQANPNYRGGAVGKGRRVRHGKWNIETAQRHYGIELDALHAKIHSDHRRASVARRLAREATSPQSWIADRLELKTRSNVSRIVGWFSKLGNWSLPKAVRDWKTLKIID